ncbi:hypothetical protein R6Q59_000242 [Mikania micrantha]
MDAAKDVSTPLSSTDPLSPSDPSPSVDATPYRKLVGSLQYLAFTRPDISFAINKLSQFMHNPRQAHWQSLKRVLRYLKGTIHHGLFLHRHSPLTLSAFSDSDWGGVTDAGRQLTCRLYYILYNILLMEIKRQNSVSRNPLKQNTQHSLMPRPNSIGFNTSYMNLASLQLKHRPCFVTTQAIRIYVPIRCIVPV